MRGRERRNHLQSIELRLDLEIFKVGVELRVLLFEEHLLEIVALLEHGAVSNVFVGHVGRTEAEPWTRDLHELREEEPGIVFDVSSVQQLRRQVILGTGSPGYLITVRT
jgi:hypothetical protein